jgi:hypothetical protein
MKFNPNIKKL